MRRGLPRALAAALAAVSLLAAAPGPAVAVAATDGAPFAPVDRPGPALSVSKARLGQSVACTSNVVTGRQAVLFVPGTTVNPREDYSWNWFRAMDKLDRPYCAVTLPMNTSGDIQVSAEYVVNAIRTVRARTNRKVQVIGHSQGGNLPRFALRFWPDVRPMVEDYIGFAATNHGSVLIDSMCVPSCMPALWQQMDNSDYVQAMNSHQETFEGISYTSIYTHLDQFVQPNLDDTGTSSLSGPGDITNVALQDICPGNTAEHLAIGTFDPVAYALAMDALTHPGPADPARIASSVCTEALMPGVDPRTFAVNFADAINQIFVSLVSDPRVDAEPPLKPYTLATS